MSQLCLRNRQHIRRVDLRLLRRIVRTLVEDLLGWRHFELGAHLVAAPEITRLNETYLGHEGPTDVLAFDHTPRLGPLPSLALTLALAPDLHPNPNPNSHPSVSSRSPARLQAAPPGAGMIAETALEHYGELFICTDIAVAQARRFRATWQEELVRYLIHGLLHLQGHDDQQPAARRRMKREEARLLVLLQQRFPLNRLERQS